MTESTSLSTNKVIVLPDGRKLILPNRDLSKVITPSFLKQVPNDTISRRQSKIRHKVKKRQPRGMNGTSNRAGAAYAGAPQINEDGTKDNSPMEKLLMQNKFLPRAKEERLLKRGGPNCTKPTYDVDTFGLQRSSHKREGVQKLILPNGMVIKLG